MYRDVRIMNRQGESTDNLIRHRLPPHADREIVPAALRLRTPVPVRRDADLTHGIMLQTILLIHVNTSFLSGITISFFTGQFNRKKPLPAEAAGQRGSKIT